MNTPSMTSPSDWDDFITADVLPESPFGVTEVRTSQQSKKQQAPTTASVASGQHVPAVNMAEELLEAVEKLQFRLTENQEPRKVRNVFGETCSTSSLFAPCTAVLYVLRRVSSLRFDQHCYPEIPRLTITRAADREMDDRFK